MLAIDIEMYAHSLLQPGLWLIAHFTLEDRTPVTTPEPMVRSKG